MPIPVAGVGRREKKLVRILDVSGVQPSFSAPYLLYHELHLLRRLHRRWHGHLVIFLTAHLRTARGIGADGGANGLGEGGDERQKGVGGKDCGVDRGRGVEGRKGGGG